MKFKKRFLALALAGMMFFTACGGGGNAGKSGGEQYINALMDNEPTTMDAQKGSDMYSNKVINNIYEPLLRLREKDGKLELEEAGAEKYEVSDDGLTYTFHLRDFNWEDGKAVSAKDYEYGIKRAADPNTGAESAFLLAPIANFNEVNTGKKPIDELGVKALDDKTLEVKLSQPAAYFPRLVPYRVMQPQRQDIVEQHGESFASEADKLIGCGPFKLTSWVHNSELTLEKSDTYWDKDTVQLSKINYKIITDVNTALNAFDVGEIDTVLTTLPDWVKKLDAKEGVSKDTFTRPAVDYLTLNSKDDLFKNQKIRQAFQIALDRQGLLDQVYQGANSPAVSWTPPSIGLGDQNYAELRNNEPITELKNANPDPKKLMAEGLKELGMDPDPSKITIDFQMTNAPILKSLGEFIQANLKETLGVNINLNMMEWPVLNTNVSKGNYQMAFLAWSADYDDPHAMLSLFTSNAEAVNTGWSSEEYDKLIVEASAKADPKEAAELYGKAETILIENSPVVPILNVTTNFYKYDYVKGMSVSDFATTGYKYVYIENR